MGNREGFFEPKRVMEKSVEFNYGVTVHQSKGALTKGEPAEESGKLRKEAEVEESGSKSNAEETSGEKRSERKI